MTLTRETCDDIKTAVNNILTSSLKDQKLIKSIADKVSEAITKTVHKELQEFKNKLLELELNFIDVKKENEDKIVELQNEVRNLNKIKIKVEQKCDNLEQQIRGNNLRIFNLTENNQENLLQSVISFLNSKMLIKLKNEDIELCQRINRKEKSQKPKCVFLKLKDNNTKTLIYNKKKLLKGTGVIIKEDLTPERVKLVSKLTEEVGLRNVWTSNGKIYVNHEGNISILQNSSDIEIIFGR